MRGPFWVTNVPEEKKSKLKKISRELKSSPQNEICTYERDILDAVMGERESQDQCRSNSITWRLT